MIERERQKSEFTGELRRTLPVVAAPGAFLQESDGVFGRTSSPISTALPLQSCQRVVIRTRAPADGSRSWTLSKN